MDQSDHITSLGAWEASSRGRTLWKISQLLINSFSFEESLHERHIWEACIIVHPNLSFPKPWVDDDKTPLLKGAFTAEPCNTNTLDLFSKILLCLVAFRLLLLSKCLVRFNFHLIFPDWWFSICFCEITHFY